MSRKQESSYLLCDCGATTLGTSLRLNMGTAFSKKPAVPKLRQQLGHLHSTDALLAAQHAGCCRISTTPASISAQQLTHLAGVRVLVVRNCVQTVVVAVCKGIQGRNGEGTVC